MFHQLIIESNRYYPDFLIEVKENNRIKKYVIEIKPKKQTSPPPKKSRVTKSYIYECKTFEVNRAKWRAAREFCIDNGLEFKIITEEEPMDQEEYLETCKQ